MVPTMGPSGESVKSQLKGPISATKARQQAAGLIILNVLSLSNEGVPLLPRCSMRFSSVLLACASLLAATAASGGFSAGR